MAVGSRRRRAFGNAICRNGVQICSRGRRWYPGNYYIFVLLCALPIPGILRFLTPSVGWQNKRARSTSELAIKVKFIHVLPRYI